MNIHPDPITLRNAGLTTLTDAAILVATAQHGHEGLTVLEAEAQTGITYSTATGAFERLEKLKMVAKVSRPYERTRQGPRYAITKRALAILSRQPNYSAKWIEGRVEA